MRLAQLLPPPVRELIRDSLRHSAIRRALKPLKANGSMTCFEAAAFRKAWGNGFSAYRSFLIELIALLSRGPVLECGCGGTTLIEGIVGARRGFEVYCLEQDRQYSEAEQWDLPAVSVVHAPLCSYGSYHWYELRQSLPDYYPLIVCDGPYIDPTLGEPSYSAWRYGLMAWMHENHKTFDVILLDDVNDPRGPALLERWQKEFGVKVERKKSADGELALITP